MNILFYRYGSICEPDIIDCMQKMGICVEELTNEMTDKNISPGKCAEIVSDAIRNQRPAFVFSINFFPAIAQVCQIYKVLYLCWTVDSPVFELFSRALQCPTNRIFFFDRAQLEYFGRFNPECCFHLPLATNVALHDLVNSQITQEDRNRFSGDISFVGSLYTEKNPLHRLQNLSPYAEGYLNGLVEASLKVYGYNFLEEALPDSIVEELQNADPHFYRAEDPVTDVTRYVAAHHYLGMQAAETERIRTLNELAKYFDVHLYTLSDTSPLEGVKIHGGVKSLSEMPKVFHLSKINLNMTIKPIQTGLPQRIFDVMGSGGFLMTNYQAELTEHFEIGVDLEAYASQEELLDKCAYYLSHEEERSAIARRGYEKVKNGHTYSQRVLELMHLVTSTEAKGH